jgi:surface polysaccharide O-acyltransferase-like enzyme
MYAIIALYIAAPLLRVFNMHASRKLKWYVIACWFLAYSAIPYFDTFASSDFGLNLGFVPQYAGFMLLGSLLSEYTWRIRPLFSALVFLAASLSTFALTVWFSHKTGAPDETFYAYIAPNVVIAGAGLYLLLARLGEKIPDYMGRVIKILSACSFGIYLVHIIIMDALIKIVFNSYYQMNFANIYSVVNIPLISTACAFISFIIIFCMRKVPLLKHVA